MRDTRQKRRLERIGDSSKPYQLVAQRKFASNASPPASPSTSSNLTDQGGEQKYQSAEDFLDFLCLRNQPFLPSHLEHFADLRNNRVFIEDSETNESENELFKNNDDSSTSSMKSSAQLQKLNKRNNFLTGKIKDISKYHATSKEMKNIFDFILQKPNQSDSSILFWGPPDWLVQNYNFDPLRFDVVCKHIHRLKDSMNENFVTLLSIQRQLNRECQQETHIPHLGCNEIDLVRLYQTVTAYGGIETVNDTQSWKHIADQICLAKEYPGRVVRLEEHYLRYIIPYANLSENDRIKLRSDIIKDSANFTKCKFTKRKSMTWKSFLRLSKNLKKSYIDENMNTNDIETEFWDIIDRAESHVVGASAEVIVTDDVCKYQAMKSRTWNFKNIYTHEGSALKYLPSCEELVQPHMVFNSLFAVSEWSCVPYHLHMMSYIHNGADKIWYVVGSNQKDQLQDLLQNDIQTLLKPQELIQNGIHIERFVQKEGDYVVIKPNSYYLTISTGYSFAEQVYLAPIVWIFSSFLQDYVYKLNEHKVVSVIVTTSQALCKKKSDSEIVRILIDKLKQFKEFLQQVFEKLSRKGIKNVVAVTPSTMVGRECSKCGSPCSLISIQHLKSKNSSLCVEDSIKILKGSSNVKTANSMLIECFMTPDNIENIRLKLQKKLEE